MTRYTPSPNYLSAGLVAIGLAAFSGWYAREWAPAAIPAVLFIVSALLLLALATRPSIEVHDQYLAIGKRAIPWAAIQRVDRTGWISPLVVSLTLSDGKRAWLIFPGDLDSANSLLRRLRRCAASALIDGVPHWQFWGEAIPPSGERTRIAGPRYRILREEDEAEVERLYQRLKTVGNLDAANGDEKEY
ncbi:MAG: DUF3093 family protein [Bryobacteraceae bacterium]|nr:DUF3093 family protein [Bryobacteraceae bacterium]